jgi:hypothetical protein
MGDKISTVYNTIDNSIKLTNSSILTLDKNTSNYQSDTNRRFGVAEESAILMRKNIFENSSNIRINSSNIRVNNSNIDINHRYSSAKFTGIDTNFNNINNNLDKFFKFNNNGAAIGNKIFEEINFGSANLNLLSPVTTMNDIIICDNANNCVKLNITDEAFNISTSNFNNIKNVKNMNILNKNGKVMANFNMNDNSIFLGGSNLEAPIIIKNNEVYVRKLNLINALATNLTLDNLNANVTSLVSSNVPI